MWPGTVIYALSKDEHREALNRTALRGRDVRLRAARQRRAGRSPGIDE